MFTCQCLYSWQLLPFEKFQRRSATGGDMRNLVGDSGCLHSRNRIAAAYDGCCARIVGDGMRDLECALGKRRPFEDAHWAVPHNSRSAGNFLGEEFDGLRADV